jgi:hypothetical protein
MDTIMPKKEGTADLLTNLKEIGYGSHYMAPSMGSIYLIILFTLAGLIAIVILQPLRKLHHRIFKF